MVGVSVDHLVDLLVIQKVVMLVVPSDVAMAAKLVVMSDKESVELLGLLSVVQWAQMRVV
jgi:hypothetical protein